MPFTKQIKVEITEAGTMEGLVLEGVPFTGVVISPTDASSALYVWDEGSKALILHWQK